MTVRLQIGLRNVLLSLLFICTGAFVGAGRAQGQQNNGGVKNGGIVAKTRKTPTTTAPAEFLRFLNEKEIRVQVWDQVPSSRMSELGARMRAAIAKNQEWWLEYSRNAEPGKPLPYHTNLGLTREEYDEFLRLAEKSQFHIVSDAALGIDKIGKYRFRLQGNGETRALDGIVINRQTLEVETELGRCQSPQWRPQDPERKLLGQSPWEGWHWDRDAFDVNTLVGSIVSLTIGRIPQRNEWFIYFKASARQKGKQPMSTRIIVTFKHS